MAIPLAYLSVVIIWSTTPLAIQWSGLHGAFAFGLAARMAIGLLALLLIMRLQGVTFPWHHRARKVYLAGGLSLYVAMTLVYWAAQYIPSGWIAVVFGLSPIFTSLFARYLLAETAFGASQSLGMLLGLGGLLLVFHDSLHFGGHAWWGIVGVLLSALAQSLGAVMLKKLKPGEPALAITAGSLVIALPGFIANVAVFGGLPARIEATLAGSIVYLALLGTATGFPLYYYLLKHISAQKIALITLITPVSALLIGAGLNAEPVSPRVWGGAALIIAALSLYQYGRYLPPPHKWRLRWWQRPL